MIKPASIAVLVAITFSLTSPCPAATATKAAPQAGTSGALSNSDKTFLEKANQVNLQEVKLGKLADEKSKNADVKDLSGRLIHDHSELEDSLKKLSESKGVKLADAVDASGQKTYERLAKLSGPEFDKAYTDLLVKDHTAAVAQFKEQEKQTKDAPLKDWVSGAVKTLEGHLKLSKEVQSKVAEAGKTGAAKK